MVNKKCSLHKQAINKGPSPRSCLKKSDPLQLFLQNIKDVAYTLIDVMIICGIPERNAKSARETIINSFKHYDEVRYRIGEMPKRALRKEHLIFDLSCNCMMTRMEAQLTYSIIKRAFRAFYYCTDEFGIPDSQLEAKTSHRQECLWVHAAKRTAEIYADFENMFYEVQKKFEERIKSLYKELYERMQKRSSLLALSKCGCKYCTNTNESLSLLNFSYDTSFFSLTDSTSSSKGNVKQIKSVRKLFSGTNFVGSKHSCKTLTDSPKCKCSKLSNVSCVCDESFLNNESSQVQSKVRWVPNNYKSETIVAKCNYETPKKTEKLNPPIKPEPPINREPTIKHGTPLGWPCEEEEIFESEDDINYEEACYSEEIGITETSKSDKQKPDEMHIAPKEENVRGKDCNISAIKEEPCTPIAHTPPCTEKSINSAVVTESEASAVKKECKPTLLSNNTSAAESTKTKPPKPTKIVERDTRQVTPATSEKLSLLPLELKKVSGGDTRTPQTKKTYKVNTCIPQTKKLNDIETSLSEVKKTSEVDSRLQLQPDVIRHILLHIEVQGSLKEDTLQLQPRMITRGCKTNIPIMPGTPIQFGSQNSKIQLVPPIKVEVPLRKEIKSQIKPPRKVEKIRSKSFMKERSIINMTQQIPFSNHRKDNVLKRESKHQRICKPQRKQMCHSKQVFCKSKASLQKLAYEKVKVMDNTLRAALKDSKVDVISSEYY